LIDITDFAMEWVIDVMFCLKTFDQFSLYLSSQPKDHFVSTVSDFHLLLYLATAEAVDVIQASSVVYFI
jgi:hypothetical protein